VIALGPIGVAIAAAAFGAVVHLASLLELIEVFHGRARFHGRHAGTSPFFRRFFLQVWAGDLGVGGLLLLLLLDRGAAVAAQRLVKAPEPFAHARIEEIHGAKTLGRFVLLCFFGSGDLLGRLGALFL